jgi:hypothetical protein
MKKRLSGFSKTATAAQILGMGLLLLISCNNVLISPREGSPAGSGETGTVLISFGNGVEGARTLLPSGVSFQRYDLTIEPVYPSAGSVAHETISSGSSATIALAPGAWTIHVDAYTDTGGSNKAAEGDSEPFTVSANQTTPVTITLAALTGAGDGTLSVAISDKTSSVISGGSLRIYTGMDFTDPVAFNNEGWDNYTLSFSSTEVDMDISLPVGQYRVAAVIYNNKDQRAYINEVAYIYSNLTTELVREVAAADFTDVTVINGTVRYQENGVDQSRYGLYISTDPEGNGNYLYSTYIASPGAQSYTLYVPQPDKNVTLYFSIYPENGLWFYAGDSLTLTANQASATKDISMNRSSITLSGSIGAVTVNGNAPDSVDVYARAADRDYWGSVSGNTWEIPGIPDDFTGTLTIGVDALYDGRWYQKDTNVTWTSGSSSPTTGISLGDVAFNFITLSGSIGTVTVNGSAASFVSVYARTSDHNSYGGPVSGNTWEISDIPGDFTGTLTIGVYAEHNGTGYSKDITTWTSGPSSPTTDISLGDVAFNSIALSGSIGAVTVNGSAQDSVSVYAHTSDNNNYYWGSVSGNTWEITNIPYDFTGTLIISVRVEDNGIWREKDVATWTSGPSSPTTGISLGDVAFNFIILSGSIGAVTVNGNVQDSVDVYAHTSNYSYHYRGSVSGATWEISGIPNDFTGTLIIAVEVEYNGTWREKDVATWTPGQSTTINLGPISFITLSGSIGTVTVSGSAPDYINVYARTANRDNYWGSVRGNAWEIVIPGDFTGTLTIGVEAGYNGDWHQKDTNVTWTSASSPTTGISLGNVAFNFITLSGSIGAVTVSGSAPDYINVYARTARDNYWGSVNGNTWEITNIPGDFTGTLTIAVGVEYNGAWGEKDLATWTSGDSTTINLGPISFITLSGSIGTVTVNGSSPEAINVYAHVADRNYWGSLSGNAWEIIIPGDFTGTLAIGVELEYNGTWHQKDTTVTWTSGPSSPTTGINLGNVSISLSPIGGTIINAPSSGTMYGVYVLNLSQPPVTFSEVSSQTPLGNADIDDGKFSGYVTSGVASGYLLVVGFGISNPVYYITPSAVTLGTSMSLNMATMTLLVDD